MAGALAGITIVDLSQIVSGPMAAMLLADQGADVIKVETPGGDPVRMLGPRKRDISSMFLAVNRGKRGIAIDLKSPGGCTVLERLIARADVLIENFRPQAMERLGFGYDRCRAINPRLVFASINGFGPDGPYANIRVYDPVIQAVSGIAATQTDKEGKPSLVRSLIADKVTALTAAQAITAALFHRERTGDGPAGRHRYARRGGRLQLARWHVQLRLSRRPAARVSALWCDHAAVGGGRRPGGDRCALQNAEFVALCKAIGRDDLAGDTRFNSVNARMQHQKEWAPAVSATLAGLDLDALMAGFIREGAVGGRVNTLDAVLDDPQVLHNAIVTEAAAR